MTTMEIILIVLTCCVPVVAFLLTRPIKLKKKAKKESIKEPEQKTEEVMPVESYVKEETEPFGFNDSIDYKDYAIEKQKRTTVPELKHSKSETSEFVPDYIRNGMEIARGGNSKPLVQQIGDLSPELKAILLSGAISDPKFDD